MATYKEIFGKQIKFLSSDPANESEGQIWYNSTSGTFKSTLVSEAWSSGSSMISARGTLGGASAGTQTATVFFGGYDGSVSNLTEEYNGSGWSAGGVLGTARYYIGGSGTLTAGLGFTGGAGTPGGANATGATEEYDGSSWTAGGTMSTGRVYVGIGAGTQTATFCFGGSTVPYPPGSPTNLVEEYNGASWTSSPAMPRSSRLSLGFGTTTAAVNCGGNDFTTTTDEWNGTGWSGGGAMLAATDAGASMGIQTAGIIAGGGNPSTAFLNTSSKYDGTTWTALPAIATARRHMPGAGTTTAAVIGGGETPTRTAATEEFNRSANVITAGAWASGGALNTARRQFTGTGNTQATSLAIGGKAPATTATEEYDGSVWTTSPATLGTGRYDLMSVGSQSAALGFGGYVPGGGSQTAAEAFNGSAWTASPALATAKHGGRGAGTSTAAICFGGEPHPSPGKETQIWNNVAWTTSPLEMNTNRGNLASAGQVDTAVLAFGGSGGDAPGAGSTATESWNGSAWTTVSSMPTALRNLGGAGLGDAALAFGGSPGAYTLTSGWDGTAWSTRPSMATARDNLEGSGIQTAALAFGGVSGPGTTLTATEAFSGPTSTANYKTITTS